MNLPAIHISIVQPAGYVHSLGLLDPARYFRWQFRRLGAEVTIAKNRLRHDAVNFVFGAHLGFDPAQRERHACVFVNLEQLGEGGAQVAAGYRELIATSAVCDYDADNVPAYAPNPADVAVVPLLHAPYLAPRDGAAIPLEQRPIDLLFVGSLNPRRQQMIERIEALGLQVAMFDGPLYGDERDTFVRQAKAVVNMHFYATSRFEQARVSHCLSLGTPVISERGALTRPHPVFEDSVSWFREETLESFFATEFGTPAFFARARAQLAAFAQSDPVADYAELLALAASFGQAHHAHRPATAWQPARINLSAGADYRDGWLNVDTQADREPDLVLDLDRADTLPTEGRTVSGEAVRLEPGSVETIRAVGVLEQVADPAALVGWCLRLLKTGGTLEVEAMHERSPLARQEPGHRRALNENSWVYFTEGFWRLGWLEHRFEIAEARWLDLQRKPCTAEQGALMRVTLRKIETTPRERMTARTQRCDFGGFADDDVPPVATPQAIAA